MSDMSVMQMESWSENIQVRNTKWEFFVELMIMMSKKNCYFWLRLDIVLRFTVISLIDSFLALKCSFTLFYLEWTSYSLTENNSNREYFINFFLIKTCCVSMLSMLSVVSRCCHSCCETWHNFVAHESSSFPLATAFWISFCFFGFRSNIQPQH